jgi:hypothetical protein
MGAGPLAVSPFAKRQVGLEFLHAGASAGIVPKKCRRRMVAAVVVVVLVGSSSLSSWS